MLVSDEDVAKLGQWDVGKGKLTGDSVTTIDDICHIIRENDLGRRRTALPWPGAAAGAQQNEPSSEALPFALQWEPCSYHDPRGSREESSTVDDDGHLTR